MQITKNRIKEKSKDPKNMSGRQNGMLCLSGLIVLFKMQKKKQQQTSERNAKWQKH